MKIIRNRCLDDDCKGRIAEEETAILTEYGMVEGVMVYCTECKEDFTDEFYG